MKNFLLLKQEIKDTLKFKLVVENFVTSTLKHRYRRTVLGFFWSVLGPMLHYLVMGFVFSYFMRAGIQDYPVYMFSGALVFSLISSVFTRSSTIMINNEHYIKKIYIPKLVYILDVVMVEFVNFALSLLALLMIALVFHKIHFSLALFSLVAVIICVLFFLIGAACILSVLGTYFRDTAHIIPILLQATFFGTPILYKAEMMPEHFKPLIYLNPFYYFIEMFRTPIYYNRFVSLNIYVVGVVLSVSVLITGLLVLKIYDNKIVFKL